MLYRFHVILVACGILFSFGVSVHQFLAWERAGSERPGAAWSLVVSLVLAAGGVALSWYFGKLRRLGWWSRGSAGGDPPRR